VVVDSSLDDPITTKDNTIPDTFDHDQSTCDDFTQITGDDESQPVSETTDFTTQSVSSETSVTPAGSSAT